MAKDHDDTPLGASDYAQIRRLSQPRERDPSEAGGELNIVPFLDIIMNVLMFVLATIPAVFTATALVTPPHRGGPRDNAPVALNLSLLIVGDGIAIKASGGAVGPGCEPGGGVTVGRRGDDYDWAGLRACATKIKGASTDFDKETDVKILADPGVPYQTVIAAMDAVRQRDDGEPLFPDVNFALPR